MKMIKHFILVLIISFLCYTTHGMEPVSKLWSHDVQFSLNSINKANALQVDKQGNSYILGTTWYIDSTKDILLEKVDADGKRQWIRTYDNPMHGDDLPLSICLDPAGNIWICGMAKTNQGNADFLLLKFDSEGSLLFDYLHDGNDHLFDCANAIAADKSGNVYAAGYETSLDSGINMIVMKFQSDGRISWVKRYTTLQMDVANQLITDDSSNVYVCGTINNGLHSADLFVIKYDPAGKEKWKFIFNGQLSQSDFGKVITKDDSMHLYISGYINHSNDRADIPVFKLNRNGRLLEETFYHGKISDCSALHVLANKKEVFVTGGCMDYTLAENTFFVFSIDKGGNEKFTLKAPEDITFKRTTRIGEENYICGFRLVHPAGTILPYIARMDSVSLDFVYSDSSVYGLAHIVDIVSEGNSIYFLGDDTGDATGTIRLFKYSIKSSYPSINKKIKKKK